MRYYKLNIAEFKYLFNMGISDISLAEDTKHLRSDEPELLISQAISNGGYQGIRRSGGRSSGYQKTRK
jgi:hypothetical protein